MIIEDPASVPLERVGRQRYPFAAIPVGGCLRVDGGADAQRRAVRAAMSWRQRHGIPLAWRRSAENVRIYRVERDAPAVTVIEPAPAAAATLDAIFERG